MPLSLVVLAALATPVPTHGEETVAEAVEPAEVERPHADEAERPRRWMLFPREVLYPRYLADPDAPATGVTLQFFSSTEIEPASDRRQHVKLGGAFPLVRLRPRRPGGRRWQLRIDGGLDAQFDPENQTDNTGWDGNYGLIATSDREDEDGLAFKLGIFHISAHLGDEWIERTGRRRIGYRREEWVGAVAWGWGRGRRTYVEAGWAYDTLSEVQEPARMKVGAEWEGEVQWLPRATGWYAALDLSAWAERDWKVDTGAQVGLVARPHGRAWRLGLQYWDGRVPLGEFFAETEGYLALGLWVDV